MSKITKPNRSSQSYKLGKVKNKKLSVLHTFTKYFLEQRKILHYLEEYLYLVIF